MTESAPTRAERESFPLFIQRPVSPAAIIVTIVSDSSKRCVSKGIARVKVGSIRFGAERINRGTERSRGEGRRKRGGIGREEEVARTRRERGNKTSPCPGSPREALQYRRKVGCIVSSSASGTPPLIHRESSGYGKAINFNGL